VFSSSSLLQLAVGDQVVRNLLCASERVSHRMDATRYAGLRFRAGDVVEPVLTAGDRRAAIRTAEYQVHECMGEVVGGTWCFDAVPEEEVQSSRRQNATHRIGAHSRSSGGVVGRIPDGGIRLSKTRAQRSAVSALHGYLALRASAAPIEAARGRSTGDFGHRENVAGR